MPPWFSVLCRFPLLGKNPPKAVAVQLTVQRTVQEKDRRHYVADLTCKFAGLSYQSAGLSYRFAGLRSAREELRVCLGRHYVAGLNSSGRHYVAGLPARRARSG